MRMRLVPLLSILHRLGAVQHFSRAYDGAPSFAERPGTITYIELTTTDWTTDPPTTRTPIYSPARPTCTRLPRLTPRPPTRSSACSWRTCPPATGSDMRVSATPSSVASRPRAPCAQRPKTIFLPQQPPAPISRFSMPTVGVSAFLLQRLPCPLNLTHTHCTLPYAVRCQLRYASVPILFESTVVSALPRSPIRRPSSISVPPRSTRRVSPRPLLAQPPHPLRRMNTTGYALSASGLMSLVARFSARSCHSHMRLAPGRVKKYLPLLPCSPLPTTRAIPPKPTRRLRY